MPPQSLLPNILTSMIIYGYSQNDLKSVFNARNIPKVSRILRAEQAFDDINEDVYREMCHTYQLPALSKTDKYGKHTLAPSGSPQLIYDMASALQNNTSVHSQEYKMLQHLKFTSLVSLSFSYEYDREYGKSIGFSEENFNKAKSVLDDFLEIPCASKNEKELISYFHTHNNFGLRMIEQESNGGFEKDHRMVDESMSFAKKLHKKLIDLEKSKLPFPKELDVSYRLMFLLTTVQTVEMALLCNSPKKAVQALGLKAACINFFGKKYDYAFDIILYLYAWDHSRTKIRNCFHLPQFQDAA